MTTKSTHHLPAILSVLLLAGFTVTSAWAGTTYISFENDVGLLTDQTPPGVLTTPPGDPKHGVFSGSGYVFLSDGGRVETTKPNEVSIVAKLQPFTDLDSGVTLCMFIADASDTGYAVTACFDADNADLATLRRPDGSWINLGINFWGATQDYTLTYNTQTEEATLMRQNNGVSVSLSVAFGIDDPTSVVVGITTDGTARVRAFTATGVDIPDYPSVGDPLIPSNPWVDFSLTETGNGAQTDPFKLLSEALAAADPGATISIVPGTDSTEQPTINQSVTLANSDFAIGSVSIGVSARSAAPEEEQRTGFISKGPSPNR